MKIGATGHQRRPGLDWAWTAAALERFLIEQTAPLIGISSLAAGADQIFARTVLDIGGHHIALIPVDDYERCFDQPDALATYRDLLARSETVQLTHSGPDEAAFLAAGHEVVERCDALVAIWDGKKAEGAGGTADVVSYACEIGRPVVQFNPFSRSVRRI